MFVFPRQTGRLARRTLLLAASALIAALLTIASGPAAAPAAAASAKSAAKSSSKKKAARRSGRPVAVSRARLQRSQRLLTLRSSGTHDRATRASVRRFQGLRGIAQHGVVDMTTYREINASFLLLTAAAGTGSDSAVRASRRHGGITVGTPVVTFVLPEGLAPITAIERRILDSISKCESGGNAQIVSSNRLYRGLYQFSTATWKTVGGTGDPARATAEEQDQRAAILLRRQGVSPWPTCGRKAV